MRKAFILTLIAFALAGMSCSTLNRLIGCDAGEKEATGEVANDADGNYFAAKPAEDAGEKANKEEVSMRAEKFEFEKKQDKEANEQNTFFVILGSYSEKENADRFKTKLSGQGFKPFVLLSETGNLRICVNSYKDEMQARERVLSIRNRLPEYLDAWLLIKE